VHLLLLLLAEVRQLLSRSFPIEQLLLMPQPERVDRLQVLADDLLEVARLEDGGDLVAREPALDQFF